VTDLPNRIGLDISGLDADQLQQLHMILRRAASAPSIGPVVADRLTRAAACAWLSIPLETRQADARRQLDDALTPEGRVRDRW
jgi:hypothetical protein